MGLDNKKYSGFYRGIVVDNVDPNVKGRIRVYIPGIYPEEFKSNANALPWCEPAMSLFGGTFTSLDGAIAETGVCSNPHIDAHVWVFFEQGDHTRPIYCFGIQAGAGWFSEHENQHVIQTDNVRIRIDENPKSPRSTSKFDSYNTNCTYKSLQLATTDIETTLDIEVTGNTNIKIKGSCNIQIDGDCYHEITGDYHQTIGGNYYCQVAGTTHVVHEGETVMEYNADYSHIINANHNLVISGTKIETVSKDRTVVIIGTELRTVGRMQTINTTMRSLTTIGSHTVTTIGQLSVLTAGIANITTSGIRYDTTLPGTGDGSHNINATTINLN